MKPKHKKWSGKYQTKNHWIHRQMQNYELYDLNHWWLKINVEKEFFNSTRSPVNNPWLPHISVPFPELSPECQQYKLARYGLIWYAWDYSSVFVSSCYQTSVNHSRAEWCITGDKTPKTPTAPEGIFSPDRAGVAVNPSSFRSVPAVCRLFSHGSVLLSNSFSSLSLCHPSITCSFSSAFTLISLLRPGQVRLQQTGQ